MRFKIRRQRSVLSFSATSIIMIILLLFVFIFWRMETRLKPTLLAIAETKATVIATQTINNVITNEIASAIDHKSLVNITLDDRGRVVLIQPNTMEFNKLAANTTMKVQNSLKEMPNEKIYIPMGQIFGNQFVAAWGPKLVVTVVPMGTVETKVIDTFEQAGINQTRHMIYLLITTQIRIVIPLVSKNINVNTQVPVAEYIVVGDVPGTYVQFPIIPNADNH